MIFFDHTLIEYLSASVRSVTLAKLTDLNIFRSVTFAIVTDLLLAYMPFQGVLLYRGTYSGPTNAKHAKNVLG